MKKVISVYKIEYEMGENNSLSNWSVFIAGHDQKEVITFLGKFLGKNKIRINSIGLECRLDAITNEIKNDILKNDKIKNDTSLKSDKKKVSNKLPTIKKVQKFKTKKEYKDMGEIPLP